MKTNLKFIAAIITVAALSWAFTSSSVCNEMEYFVTGTTTTMSHFDGKGKPQGVSNSKVLKVYNSGDTVVADIESQFLDDKGKEQSKGTVHYRCHKGKLYLDMRDLMNQSGQKQQEGKDVTVKLEGNIIEYSPDMVAGQTLPDAIMTMSMYTDGQLFSTSIIKMTNRKVEAKENKTVGAGTFECFKISCDTEFSMMIGGMKIPGMARKSIDWLSFKAGTVRTESYKGDKLQSYSELTAFKKP